MSPEPNTEQATVSQATEVLEVLGEEQCSPALSSVIMNAPKVEKEGSIEPCLYCTCLERDEKLNKKMDPELVQTLLREKENRLTEDFQEHMKKEIDFIKERCDFILQNEQVRTSYMLREAHRERQEKVTALQTQLECKNMAGLMYVMCTERRKNKLEKIRLVEEYTNYIHALQDILTEAQTLILHLSKGCKTAARVDHEWREKMRTVLKEFQMFVHDYAGGTQEGDQYFFNLPALLKTEAPIVDNPIKDHCESEECEGEFDNEADKGEKPWWERLDSECRPFLMFGDMAELKPPRRREVLRTVKAAKTAPRKWKEYVFNEMFIRADCANADYIKDEYPKHIPATKWECYDQVTVDVDSKMSLSHRRVTRQSEEVRGDMGSLLKIMTSRNTKPCQSAAKASLLGARDSIEITSATKLREKHKYGRKSPDKSSTHKVVITVPNKRRTSFFDEVRCGYPIDDVDEDDTPNKSKESKQQEDDEEPDELSNFGSMKQDSLQLINQHVPDQDHRIHYEKVCPMEKCKRLQVDSFIRSLPPYMRANPFTHFEQNYEQYEVCSPEQIEILKKRIEHKQAKSEQGPVVEESPLAEWTPSIKGVAVQTSELSVSLPPCSCRCPSPTPVSSDGLIFNVKDLIPVKLAIDMINKECLYDDRIQFNRFKVLGQESKAKIDPYRESDQEKVSEIKKILKQHPSFLDIFQANTQC